MTVSKFLSKVSGIYLIIISLAMLMNMSEFMRNVNQLIQNPSLMFVTGIFTLILGILAVVSHNIWSRDWRVLITLLAWITLIKGASILYAPRFLDKITLLFLENNTFSSFAIGLNASLGLLLCYFGFRSKDFKEKNLFK